MCIYIFAYVVYFDVIYQSICAKSLFARQRTPRYYSRGVSLTYLWLKARLLINGPATEKMDEKRGVEDLTI